MSASENRTYRVYCFDGVRRALTNDLIQAASDDEAIAHALFENEETKALEEEVKDDVAIVKMVQKSYLSRR